MTFSSNEDLFRNWNIADDSHRNECLPTEDDWKASTSLELDGIIENMKAMIAYEENMYIVRF